MSSPAEAIPSPLRPAPPRLRPWVTVATALALVLLLGWTAWLARDTGGMAGLYYPAESVGRVMDRHLTFYEGYEAVPAWERGLYRFLFGTPEAVRAEIETAYRELLDYFAAHPDEATPWAVQNTQARLLVLLAEEGRSADLDAALEAFCGAPEMAVVCAGVQYAYGPDPPAELPLEVVQALRQLPLGWSADHLRLRVAERAGEPGLAAGVAARLDRLGRQWRQRTLLISLVTGGLVAAGLLSLIAGGLRRAPRWSAGALDRPWPLATGVAVGARAGLLVMVIFLVLAVMGGSLLHPNPLTLWPTLLAFLPMLWLMRRHLLSPRGEGWADAFGLTLKGVAFGRLVLLVLALLAVDWGGAMLIAWAGDAFGLQLHWSEQLGEEWIWPPWGATLMSVVDGVVWAPLFEEIAFRGLVYVSLRSRLPALPAALLTGGLFAVLHGYSLVGTLSVFWGALVMAWAFERTRSLLPAMAVHALGNGLSLAPLLLFYR